MDWISHNPEAFAALLIGLRVLDFVALRYALPWVWRSVRAAWRRVRRA